MNEGMNAAVESCRSLYLDLLKRALTNWIHGHEEFYVESPKSVPEQLAWKVLPKGAKVVTQRPFDKQKRLVGQDWPVPLLAHTMVGMKRLNNLQICAETVIRDGVLGDFVETGVWKGGASIFMRGLLKAYGDEARKVWVADSFQGLPTPNEKEFPADAGDLHHTYEELAISEEAVRQNFEAYGLLDDQVNFLKGWFSDTLPSAPIQQISLLRLDGDMYESTIVALDSLYPKLSIGGYVIVDDYCISSCKQAVADYRARVGISEEIVEIDGTGVFWRRTA